jgi:hypothetical protein
MQLSFTSTSVVAKVVLNWIGAGVDPIVIGCALIHKSFAGACALTTRGYGTKLDRLKIVVMNHPILPKWDKDSNMYRFMER